jgi:hypothetical protein
VRTNEKLAAVGEMAAQPRPRDPQPAGSISGSAQVLMAEPTSPPSRSGSSPSSRGSRSASPNPQPVSSTRRRPCVRAGPSTSAGSSARRSRCCATARRSDLTTAVEFELDRGRTSAWPTRPDHQVFWNIRPECALEAMPNGGTLRIRVAMDGGTLLFSCRIRDGRMGKRGSSAGLFEPVPIGNLPMGTGWASPSSTASSATTTGTSACAANPGQGTELEVRLPLVTIGAEPLDGAAAARPHRREDPRRLAFDSSRPLHGRGDRTPLFYERDVLVYWFSQAETVVRVMAQGPWPSGTPMKASAAPLLAGPPGAAAVSVHVVRSCSAARRRLRRCWSSVHTWVRGGGSVRPRAHACTAASRARRAWSRPWPSAAAVPFISAASLFHHFVGAALLPLGPRRFPALPGPRTTRAAAGAGHCRRPADPRRLRRHGRASALSAAILLAEAVIREGRPSLSAGIWSGSLCGRAALGISAAAVGPHPPTVRPHFEPGAHVSRVQTSIGPSTRLPWASCSYPGDATSLPLSDRLRAALFESREPFLVEPVPRLARGPPSGPARRGRGPPPDGGGPGRVSRSFLLARWGGTHPSCRSCLNLPVISIFRYP